MHGLTTSDHVASLKLYYGVVAALFVLLALTVGVARIDLGEFNVAAALLIAVVKAVLVVLYFMHVRWSSRLVWLFASGALLWLLILFMLTLSDFFTRGS